MTLMSESGSHGGRRRERRGWPAIVQRPAEPSRRRARATAQLPTLNFATTLASAPMRGRLKSQCRENRELHFAKAVPGELSACRGLPSSILRKDLLVAEAESFQIFRLGLSWCFPLNRSVHE